MHYEKFPEFDNHELVLQFVDKQAEYIGIIALHSEKMGPAVGGTRLMEYPNVSAAVSDALRLSHSMTYKCIWAGVPHGGGKGIIVANSKKIRRGEVLKSYAQHIEKLNGRFYTGEDVGITKFDVRKMLQFSKYFIGKPGLADDPAPYAAKSTFVAMNAAVHNVLGASTISGLRIAIKGVGKVGSALAKICIGAGAEVICADNEMDAMNKLSRAFPDIRVVKPGEIDKVECDVFAPCAYGNDIDESNVDSIKAKIICGGANNQITSPVIAKRLQNRSIVYVPDYIANAGGLIAVVEELRPSGYDQSHVESLIAAIGPRIDALLRAAAEENISPLQIADKIAKEKLTA